MLYMHTSTICAGLPTHIDRSPFLQDMCELPGNLQQSILAESGLQLPQELSLLPKALHQASLYTAFPSITSTATITIPFPWARSTRTVPFWDVLVTQTNLRTLDCSSSRWEFEQPKSQHVSDAFLSCILKLTNLVSLNFEGLDLHGSEVEKLVGTLNPRVLEHLNLGANMRQEGLSLNVATALGKFTCLQSLHLYVGGAKGSVISALGASVAQLQFLNALDLHEVGGLKQELPVLGKRISACSTLKDFTLRGPDGLALIKNLPEGVECLKVIGWCHELGHLMPHIARLKRLQEFRFVSPSRITAVGFYCCSPYSDALLPSRLKVLQIYTRSRSTEYLAKQISHSHHLETVSLSCCLVDESVVASLSALSNLQHIRIRGYRTGFGNSVDLCRTLSDHTGLPMFDSNGDLFKETGAVIGEPHIVIVQK